MGCRFCFLSYSLTHAPPTPRYRGHGLKFQVCTGANGLLESVFGPVVGRTHDITMWRTSRVARDIDRLRASNIFAEEDGGAADAEPVDNRWFAVGDSAYIGAPEHVLIPHDRSLPLTREQHRFNKLLSRTRVTVRDGGCCCPRPPI